MYELENQYLDKFYNLMYENIQLDKKLREKSIITSFLKTRGASRYKLLRKSTLSSSMIPNYILNSLLEKRYIQSLDDIETYVITAFGVWYIEKMNDKINEEILLEYINDEYFKIKIKKELNDDEKVILFSLLSARVFSEESSVDLKKDMFIKNKWKILMEECFDKLKELKIIRKNKEKIFKTAGNVHIVSSLFRHNNDMVQKTKGIYSYNRRQEYFLTLSKNDYFSDDKLSYLFWKIFEGNLQLDKLNDIIDFCNNIAKNYSLYLFDLATHKFAMPEYDFTIKDSLLNSIVNKDKWDRIS